jgi:hypothetical protein
MLDRFKTTKPVWCVAFAFGLTVAFARWVSYVRPAFHYNIGGIHIHHYTYGIFMLTVAGYFALVLKGPRATFWIALLYGWGAGFTFDEMGMWLNSSIDQSARWEKAGVFFGALALMVSVLLSVLLRKQPTGEQTKSMAPAGRTDNQNARFRKGSIDLLTAPEEE